MTSVRCWRVSITWEESVACAISTPAPVVSTVVCARSVGVETSVKRAARAGIGSGSLGMRKGSVGKRETTVRAPIRRRFRDPAPCWRTRPGASYTRFYPASSPPTRPTPRRSRLVAKDTLTITDNRTGRTYEVPIKDETIRATDLRQIKVAERRLRDDDLRPGVHEHRGLPERASPIIDGDGASCATAATPSSSWPSEPPSWRWPTCSARASCPPGSSSTSGTRRSSTTPTSTPTSPSSWKGSATTRTRWAMLLGVVGALSTFYPDAKNIHDPANRYLQRVRLLAKAPTIAAFAFRHSRGLPFVFPDNDLDYIGNFVNMTFSIGGRHKPNKVLQRALEILLILHADHEQNCSTSAVRAVGSSHVDPFSAVSGGHRGALRAAPRRRQRGRARDARRDRRQGEHSRRSSRR